VPILVRIILVQKSLIGAVEAVTARGQGLQRPVCAHIWLQCHDTSVEGIRPANVWRSGEWRVNVEQLVWRTESNDIGIEKDNLAELDKSPDVDLCERVKQVAAVEQVQVRWIGIVYAVDWNDIIVQRLRMSELSA